MAGVAKRFRNLSRATADRVRRAYDIARGLLGRNIEETNLAEKGSELEKR